MSEYLVNTNLNKNNKKAEQREEEKRGKFHKIFMCFVNIVCWSVLFFYLSFFIIWIGRCIVMSNNWKEVFILMFNDMKFIGSYLMTAIISIFITHIIDKKIN